MSKPTIVFVDLSNVLFYSYYASLKTKKSFKSTVLDKLSRINNAIVPDEMYLAKDCPRHTIWRNDHIDNYKGTRCNKGKKEIKEHFTSFYESYNGPYKFLELERTEADDIIGIMVKKLHETHKLFVISADNDYLQLADMCEIYEVCYTGIKKKNVTASGKQLLLEKIILGDTSDNIPKIMKNIGKKTINSLFETHGYDHVLSLAKNDESFEKNRLLIDMDYIPEDIKQKIEILFKEVSTNKFNNKYAKNVSPNVKKNKTLITNFFKPRS